MEFRDSLLQHLGTTIKQQASDENGLVCIKIHMKLTKIHTPFQHIHYNFTGTDLLELMGQNLRRCVYMFIIYLANVACDIVSHILHSK